MKVEIEKAASKEEEMALIKVCEMTDDIQSAVDILHNDCRTIPVMQGRKPCFAGRTKYIIWSLWTNIPMYIPKTAATKPDTACMNWKIYCTFNVCAAPRR